VREVVNGLMYVLYQVPDWMTRLGLF
jgi:hypothetical protein